MARSAKFSVLSSSNTAVRTRCGSRDSSAAPPAAPPSVQRFDPYPQSAGGNGKIVRPFSRASAIDPRVATCAAREHAGIPDSGYARRNDRSGPAGRCRQFTWTCAAGAGGAVRLRTACCRCGAAFRPARASGRPRGSVEAEILEAAAIREVREEAGITLQAAQLMPCAVISLPRPEPGSLRAYRATAAGVPAAGRHRIRSRLAWFTESRCARSTTGTRPPASRSACSSSSSARGPSRFVQQTDEFLRVDGPGRGSGTCNADRWYTDAHFP